SDGFSTGCRLSTDLPSRLLSQHSSCALADQRMVVGNQDADLRRRDSCHGVSSLYDSTRAPLKDNLSRVRQRWQRLLGLTFIGEVEADASSSQPTAGPLGSDQGKL